MHWAYGISYETGYNFSHKYNEVILSFCFKQYAIAIKIYFHIHFRIFDSLQDLISSTIFSQLLSNVVFTASSMYQLEMVCQKWVHCFRVHIYHEFHFQSLDKAGIDLAYCIFAFLAGLSWTLVLCYHATFVTESTNDIGHHVYSSNWCLYPIFLRKYLILMIAKSQQPMLFSGFQIVGCTLLTFTTVKLNEHIRFWVNPMWNYCCNFQLTKSATSYYIMFRNMSQLWTPLSYAYGASITITTCNICDVCLMSYKFNNTRKK